MLKGLRPPTHRLDVPGVFVFPHDTAWDLERIDAERAELVEMALATARAEAVETAARAAGISADGLSPEARADAEASVVLSEDEREEAAATHPVMRYFRGETRFQLDAPDQGPRGPASAGSYLRTDATRFLLRRVPYRERARLESIYTEPDPVARWIAWAQAGVAGITTGERVEWAATSPEDKLPEDWVRTIAESEKGPFHNLITLAGACKKHSDQITSAEGKP